MCASHVNNRLHEVLEDQIKTYCDTAIIKRGYQYYQDGMVKSVRTGDDHTIYGIVTGSSIYAVVIDGDSFQYSSCSCPFEGYCKHLAAVYFEYCRSLGIEQSIIQGAYFRMLGLIPAVELDSGKRGWPDDKKNDEEQTAPVEPFENTRLSAVEWLEWIDDKYGLTWQRCRNSLHPLIPILSSLKGLARDWEKPMQRLHWGLSILFVLEQTERAIKTVDSFSRYYHEVSFMRMAEPWLEHFYQLIDQLDPLTMDEEQWSWAYVIYGISKGNALRLGEQLFDWAEIAFAIIEKLSDSREWYEQEVEHLLQEAVEASRESVNVAFIDAAIGFLYFLDKRDEEAIHYFERIPFEKIQRLLYPCAAQRMEEQEWGLVENWMSFFYKNIYPIRSIRNVGVFLTLCRRGDKDRPDLPIWRTYMLELLPYSYQELNEHWFDQSAFSEWAELQLLMGISIEEMDSNMLRVIAKQAPRVLMPLYHQSIEASIQTRNRQGYRIAVKRLKKLEKLYKADKDMSRWNRYLNGIAQRNQRLRAFQEELWKGNLLT